MPSTIEQTLQEWLERAPLGPDGRIPAERILATELGVSRAELRKVLARLEEDGRLLRQVGRGSFLQGRLEAQSRPDGRLASSEPSDDLAASSSPRDVMQARLVLEPLLAGLAAENATGRQVAGLLSRTEGSDHASAGDREAADRDFHHAIAEATRNPVLIAAYERLAEARRGAGWERLAYRFAAGASDTEHRAIANAIADRNRHLAEKSLRHHLMVEANTMLSAGA
ncbi:FadR/GntR family transcriptional regulator [Enterovirga rhinocerotis]|uniref:GntR family transcriptional regulator n=1 Tax=Enterovirga rhinocerotis TaxID=1339210 RepID=A0A4R7C7Q6_9HYPH|nr:FCD domain-containing protein [Enterovirga rhinocerotis]TDR94448.1 GntR family transcriptional regulator [Enterovirga rhinocerotis]